MKVYKERGSGDSPTWSRPPRTNWDQLVASPPLLRAAGPTSVTRVEKALAQTDHGALSMSCFLFLSPTTTNEIPGGSSYRVGSDKLIIISAYVLMTSWVFEKVVHMK